MYDDFSVRREAGAGSRQRCFHILVSVKSSGAEVSREQTHCRATAGLSALTPSMRTCSSSFLNMYSHSPYSSENIAAALPRSAGAGWLIGRLSALLRFHARIRPLQRMLLSLDHCFRARHAPPLVLRLVPALFAAGAAEIA